MATSKPPQIDQVPNDVGEWAERSTDDMYDGPLNLPGGPVELSEMPRFGPEKPVAGKGKTPAPTRRA